MLQTKKVNRKIKVLWDFRGPDARKIAEHHKLHLQEFADSEHIQLLDIGIQEHSDFFAAAYLTVHESDLLLVRDRLKPQRAVIAD